MRFWRFECKMEMGSSLFWAARLSCTLSYCFDYSYRLSHLTRLPVLIFWIRAIGSSMVGASDIFRRFHTRLDVVTCVDEEYGVFDGAVRSNRDWVADTGCRIWQLARPRQNDASELDAIDLTTLMLTPKPTIGLSLIRCRTASSASVILRMRASVMTSPGR